MREESRRSAVETSRSRRRMALSLGVALVAAGCGGGPPPDTGPPIAATDEPQYLTFALTGATGLYDEGQTGAGAGDPAAIEKILDDSVARLVAQIGRTGDGKTRKLGFTVLVIPWILDKGYPGKMENTIAAAARVALARGVAFHVSIESHYFWSSRPDLWNFFDASKPGYDPANVANVEWSDWNRTGYKWRFLDWGQPQDLGAPHMCYLSTAVQAEVARLGAKVGAATAAAAKSVADAGHPELFAGLTVDSEPSLDNYGVIDTYDPGVAMLMASEGAPKVRLGYCSLSALGYSAASPPPDLAAAEAEVNKRFLQSWAAAVAGAGVPTSRLYTHVAASPSGTPLVDYDNAPIPVAFVDAARAGWSTYPMGPLADNFDALTSELAARGNPHWASSEGAPFDGRGAIDAYGYLRRHYAAGATLVVMNAGADGSLGSALGAAVYGGSQIAEYQRFLDGK